MASSSGPKTLFLVGIVVLSLVLAGAIPFLLSSLDEAEELSEYGVGDERNTYQTICEGDTYVVTSFLNVTNVNTTPSENYAELNVTDQIGNKTVTIQLDQGESRVIDFEDYSVTLEVRNVDNDSTCDLKITHPEQLDTGGIDVLLSGMGLLVLVAMMIVVVMMIGGAIKA